MMEYETGISLVPAFNKNDRAAKWLILSVSFIVFIAVAVLSKVKADVKLSFDVHVFALVNAAINSLVTILLICGLLAARQKKYLLHKRIMTIAILLSVV